MMPRGRVGAPSSPEIQGSIHDVAETATSLRDVAKRFIFRHAPRSAFIISSLRFRRAHGRGSASERREARRVLFGGGTPAVLSGPFAGMPVLTRSADASRGEGPRARR